MLTVKELNKMMIESTITTLISSGKYKNIDDLRSQNKSLTEFCFNNKMNYVIHTFSSQFENRDYLQLLNEMKIQNEKSVIKHTDIKETTVDNRVFIDSDIPEENETLVGIESVNDQGNAKDTYENEKKHEKVVATFKKIAEIDPNQLNNEQLLIFKTIIQEPESNRYEIFFDENGEMTNTVRNENKEYFTIEIIDDKPQFVNQSKNNTKQNTNSIAKQKVLTKSNGKVGIWGSANKNDGLANTLILSFIIGSFFGIIFLAVYLKIMH